VTGDVHKLGEVLRTAREGKGVDLARVERDTKIRERYLSALERGEYRELPGAVYTKGFLRNYGSYLGLDPEYLIDLYRLESNNVVGPCGIVSSNANRCAGGAQHGDEVGSDGGGYTVGEACRHPWPCACGDTPGE
jgi:hypothetical protein